MDLSKKKLLKKVGDESSILPSNLFHYLRHVLVRHRNWYSVSRLLRSCWHLSTRYWHVRTFFYRKHQLWLQNTKQLTPVAKVQYNTCMYAHILSKHVYYISITSHAKSMRMGHVVWHCAAHDWASELSQSKRNILSATSSLLKRNAPQHNLINCSWKKGFLCHTNTFSPDILIQGDHVSMTMPCKDPV